MSTKPWQDRTGWLLTPPHFPYTYKPVDSPLHGGAVRMDFLACDNTGLFWMIEAKSVDDSSASINLLTDISPLQRVALDAVATADHSIPVLTVGHRGWLHIFDWRSVQWWWGQQKAAGLNKPELLDPNLANVSMEWTGPKNWPPHNVPLFEALRASLNGKMSRATVPAPTQQTQIVLSPLLQEPEAYRWILKRGVYTPTPVKTPLLGRSS